MKSVLCYGDSNTFGTATVDRPDGRYAPGERWPGVMAAAAGRNEGVPEIVVVCPPPTLEHMPTHAEMFDGAPPKSRELARHYRNVAAERGVHFFDAGSVVTSSAVDGFHLDPDSHAALGRAIAAEIAKVTIPAA